MSFKAFVVPLPLQTALATVHSISLGIENLLRLTVNGITEQSKLELCQGEVDLEMCFFHYRLVNAHK